MSHRTLYVGPDIGALEKRAFEWATGEADDQPGSVLYLARSHHQEQPSRDRWKSIGKPLCLDVGTLDSLVSDCHERLTHSGGVTHIDQQLRNRIVELALERLDDPSNILQADQPLPAGSLCEQVENLLTLLEFVGLQSPDEIADRFEAEDIPDQAETVVPVAEQFESVRAELLGDAIESTFRGERYIDVLNAEEGLSELAPSVDAVVLSGFSLFSPLERRLVKRIADEWPTVALLSRVTETSEAVGADRGAERRPRRRPADVVRDERRHDDPDHEEGLDHQRSPPVLSAFSSSMLSSSVPSSPPSSSGLS